MPTEADTTDTTQRLAHIRRMLAHLGQEEQEAVPDGPTDVLTELSALMDLYLSLSRLDEPARRRALDWLHQKFEADTDLARF
jgi:phosphoglycerate-specific signal transduction histidine kinase